LCSGQTISRIGRRPATRREILIAAASVGRVGLFARGPQENLEVLDAVWEGVRDRFYDHNLRGVDWAAVRAEFVPIARDCQSSQQLLSVLRKMLGRLQNSHLLLFSRQEWAYRQNILPFCFDRVGPRVYFRCALRPSNSADNEGNPVLEPGDEIISIDGEPSTRLEPVTLRRPVEILGNPNFGPKDSDAMLKIMRRGRILEFRVRRLKRPTGFRQPCLSVLTQVSPICGFIRSIQLLSPPHN